MRVLPGVAHRLNGCVDTHVTALEAERLMANCALRAGSIVSALKQSFGATPGPGSVVGIRLRSGMDQHASTGTPAAAKVEQIPVTLPEAARRTVVTGVRAPKSDAQTIRPDADLLFVAGAGWTKKQSDGKSHVDQAESLILDFLRVSGHRLAAANHSSTSRERARPCSAL